MGDLFDIGKAGISAYKNSLAATGQNIANVGTEGYSRRDASIEEISSAKADVLSLSNSAGLGVRMGGITRAFDQFLDLQLQNSSSSFSFAKSKAEVLDQLEGVLIPKNATVSTRISEFFDSLSDLAQDPSDVNLRTLAISGAKSVSREFSSLYSGLSDLRTMVHGTLELAASEFNSTLKNLSKVQNEIMGNSNKSGAPNILLDQRDKLLSKLSELAEISVDYDKSPSVSVTLGQLGNSGVLLQGNSYNQISFETGANGVSAYLKDPAGGLSGIHFSSGQLAGLVSADTLVGVTSAEVNSLATKFVQEINDIHKMGIDLNGERGGDLFTLEAVGVTKSPKNLGTSSLRIEGYSGDLSGSTLDIVFSSARSSWGVTSSDNKAIENFNSTLKLNGMTISVQGEPKDGDKFSIEMSDTTAANMSLLISDINKLAAAGLHTVQVDTKNSGSADLDISYFQEKLAPGALNLESLFSEARNAANPIKFNAAGVLGVIQGVESLEEVSVLNSQSNLRISTSLTNLSASDNVTVNLVNLGTSANETFVFNISDVFSDLDTNKDLAEILNSGAIRSGASSTTSGKSFSDLGLRAIASSTSFVIASASQPVNSDFSKLVSGSLGGASGILTAQDSSATDMSVFTREGIQISGKVLSQDEISSVMTKENGFSSEAKYRADYLPTLSNEGFSGASVTRKTTEGLDVISLSGAGLDDGANNNVFVYAANAFPASRTQLTSPVTVAASNGQSVSVSFESGMMAGQIADRLSKDLTALGMSATASNMLELSNIADGLVEFELFGNNLDAQKISVTIANSSHIGLADQINSFSGSTGITAILTGASGIVLKHVDAGNISLKDINLSSGVGISVNQLNQFGDRLLSSSKTLSDGEHLVSGGNVQIKSTSDFTVDSRASVNSAFEMGFSNKNFDYINDHADISFYADYQLDGGHSDAKTMGVVSPASKYSLTLSDPISGSLVSNFVPKNVGDFSTSAIASALVSDLRTGSTSTVFYGDNINLNNGFPISGSQIDFTLGNQKYVATINIVDNFEVRATDVVIGSKVYSRTDGLKELVARSKFSISGAENDRLAVNFEANGSDFRIKVAARDGVASGHSLSLSSTNSASEKANFHLSNSSVTELRSNEFDHSAVTNSNVGSVMIGGSEHVISFNTTSNAFTSSPALPTGVSFATETNSAGTKVRLKVSIAASVVSEDIRLKANASSATYGIVSVAAQLALTSEGVRVSNIGDQRVKSSVAINSLASEVLSIDGLRGEDLIFISNGARNPIVLGQAVKSTAEAAREYSLVADKVDPSSVNIFDFSTGHIVGSRSISGDNSTVFQGLAFDFKGEVNAGDTFRVLVSKDNFDDASNLNNMLETSLINKDTGVGGYSELFGKIVSSTGAEIQSNQQTLETAEASYQLAFDNKNEFSGVDLDTEAARLMEQQQAYQAMARVLTTARELLDTLLRSM
mgnify:FL=1